ncbi:hypothetical protein MATL_G00103320 [Megalops atlanticus]|uniref:Fat storage-inducing transmembrane protein 2 n=1 Tax=Megalops atlanticus TaxID=7932 RepID=A0A9D3Q0J2_MEGAT|nr:hypothetical protein MATL_G00103320 [Megalops atlanticus]
MTKVDGNMAAIDSVVLKLVAFWRKTVVRQKLPWLFLLISLMGSIIKELQLIPETYFSDSKNVLNVYFVKVSWGWTLLLLFPFMALSNSYQGTWGFVLRRLSSLVVATGIWYTCTQSFFYIEDVTGACYETKTMQVIRGEFFTKAECRRAGFQWHGYDISGHSFILTYSALMIAEEIAPMVHLRSASVQSNTRTNTILDALYIALNALVALWIWMFTCTSVYFHDLSHKILGTTCGILGWYLTYRVWYPKPLSPGLPPQQKQHA